MLDRADTPPGAAAHPFIDVRHPNLPTATVEIVADRVTVGRLRGVNDIVLKPDPSRYVSGRSHCVIAREGRVWRVLDDGSTTGAGRGRSAT